MLRITMITLSIGMLLTTAAAAATLQLPRTGQTSCYDAIGTNITCNGTGQDGDKLKGVAMPTPRFTDNGNGTVTDNLTGLIWLKNANCFGSQIWTTAMTSANTLANGACGLTDGSAIGQWRLPDRKELMSLVDNSNSNPALSNGSPFTSVQSGYYASSSTYAKLTGSSWVVSVGYGYVIDSSKSLSHYVWPVRGGQ